MGEIKQVMVKNAIHVYDPNNENVDFIILVQDVGDVEYVRAIVSALYSDWHSYKNEEKAASYISKKLTGCGFNHDIYFAERGWY